MRKPNKEQLGYYNSLVLDFEDGCAQNGWRRFTSKERCMDAFYNKRQGLVIKCPAFILEPKTPKHLRVPTFQLEDGWVVQPLVEKNRLKEAVDILRVKLRKYPKIFPDLHTHNVGWYKNKPLMFDW